MTGAGLDGAAFIDREGVEPATRYLAPDPWVCAAWETPLLSAPDAAAALAVHDPLWRMPLWDGYEDALKSDVAPLKNDPDAWAQAGSVTAALFLRRFAPKAGAWVHFDVFAWNPRGRPGWPVGAEAQAIRALDRVLVDRYGAETV